MTSSSTSNYPHPESPALGQHWNQQVSSYCELIKMIDRHSALCMRLTNFTKLSSERNKGVIQQILVNLYSTVIFVFYFFLTENLNLFMYKKSKISRNITAPYITILIYICTSAMPRAEKVQQKVIFERRQQCSLVVYVIISLWVSFTLSNSATFKGTLSRETQSCAWRHSYGTRANIRHLQLRQSLCETCANFFGCPPLTRT